NTKSLTTFGSYDGHGNPGSVKRWTSGSNWLTTLLSYDPATGVLSRVTEPDGAQTQYTYNTGTCAGAFPITITLPPNQWFERLTRSMTWDCNGGVPLSVTDEN